jgi:hypothetical protein
MMVLRPAVGIVACFGRDSLRGEWKDLMCIKPVRFEPFVKPRMLPEQAAIVARG